MCKLPGRYVKILLQLSTHILLHLVYLLTNGLFIMVQYLEMFMQGS